MKNVLKLFLLVLISFSLVQCDNQAKLEAQKAKAEAEKARAEADSLKKAMEMAALKEAEEASSLGLPKESIREKGKLNPVDEGQLNADFRKFRLELLSAIERKDENYLGNLLDKDIKVSFGGEQGKEDFFEYWDLDVNPKKSKVWQELRNILELGGTFDNRSQKVFTAPYVYTSFPQGYDPFEYGAITGQGVRVRNASSRGARQVSTLSYNIVRIMPEAEPEIETIGKETHPWVKIQMEDGKTGYVFGKYIRSQVDYRASFEKQEEGWKMIFMLAGD